MDSESTTNHPVTAEDLTPLEQDVLDEYERLAENMKKVILTLSCQPSKVSTILNPTSNPSQRYTD